ncbi:MAG: NUDIX hydrolase [Azoarcus sp.]|nr:NUDIX hydrolase [Azoarcus sp.]
MNYCSECGAPVTLCVPEGDTKSRYVCVQCGVVHYQNPRMIVGAIPEWGERILLCRRAIDPRYGKWTLPAGFMEKGETTSEAAARETLEEACAHIEVTEMFSLIDVPRIDQVHIFYRARLLEADFKPGEESLETALFREEEIPWEEIAFHTTQITLRHYFDDRRNGHWGFHVLAHGAMR